MDISARFEANGAFFLWFLFDLRLIRESHAHVADNLDVVREERARDVHILPRLVREAFEQPLFAANTAVLLNRICRGTHLFQTVLAAVALDLQLVKLSILGLHDILFFKGNREPVAIKMALLIAPDAAQDFNPLILWRMIRLPISDLHLILSKLRLQI